MDSIKDDIDNFRRQCERSLERSIEDRMRYGFNYTYKPILDDAPWRSFDSMKEYREWCEKNLPSYLGYGCLLSASQRMSDET